MEGAAVGAVLRRPGWERFRRLLRLIVGTGVLGTCEPKRSFNQMLVAFTTTTTTTNKKIFKKN